MIGDPKGKPLDRKQTTVLLRAARDGSPPAVNDLFERCGEKLLALIRLRLGRDLRKRLESRDILQSAMLKAFQNFEQFEGSGGKTLMGWLAAIAQNEIRDEADYHLGKRRDARLDTHLEERLRPAAKKLHTEVSRIQLKEETQRLERALESLREPHREIILLRNFEELSFGEIGERLGKSPDACRMLLARAMAALSVAMREERKRGRPEPPKESPGPVD